MSFSKLLTILIVVLGIYWLFAAHILTLPKFSQSKFSFSAVSKTTPLKRPGAVKTMAEQKNISEDQAAHELAANLEAAEQIHLKGIIIRHLDDGHLLVKGIAYFGSNPDGNRDTFALFGVPNADLHADGASVDCWVYPLGNWERASWTEPPHTYYEFVYPGSFKLSEVDRQYGVQ